MSKRTIYISQPVTGEDEWQATQEPIMSGWLTAGPKVRGARDDVMSTFEIYKKLISIQ